MSSRRVIQVGIFSAFDSIQSVFAILANIFWGVILFATQAIAQETSDFLDLTRNRELYQTAIENERLEFTPPTGVTGITVPHHLLASDLIARGFWAASGGNYDRVIIIAPDHFRMVKGKFATTLSDFSTVFGEISNDTSATAQLLALSALFEPLHDMSKEHGWHAVTPLVKHFWPQARIVPVLASIKTTRDDWLAVAQALLAIVGPNTLVIQSTDYSHYLPVREAVLRDQESISLIGSRNPDGVVVLLQPEHMDSKAAQFIQMTMQNAIGASPVILGNRNSVEYSPNLSSTTSYIVTAYVKHPLDAVALRYRDQSLVNFAGDVFLGRYFVPALLEPRAVETLVKVANKLTNHAPLIVNFEGVLLDELPVGLPAQSHLMLSELAVPVLRKLGIVAAGLANNHSADLGGIGYSETARLLSSIEIIPMHHGEVVDLGTFRVLPLDLYSSKTAFELSNLDFVCDMDAPPPLIAFVHWGREYVNVSGKDEIAIAYRLLACGVSLIVGTHSHLASQQIDSLAGGAGQVVYSLGNFAFDQTERRSSGALLEVRVFRQGTFATRLVPIPNLYKLANRVLFEQESPLSGQSK